MSFINKRIQFIKPRKNFGRPSNFPVIGTGIPMRITQMFPLKLKDISSDKLHQQKTDSEASCVQEMMTLFDCFEKSDFNTSACLTQAKLLEKCYETHMAKKRMLKAGKTKNK